MAKKIIKSYIKNGIPSEPLPDQEREYLNRATIAFQQRLLAANMKSTDIHCQNYMTAKGKGVRWVALNAEVEGGKASDVYKVCKSYCRSITQFFPLSITPHEQVRLVG